LRHSNLWIYGIATRLQRYELCERLGLTRLRVFRRTRLRLKERALVPLLLWQTYRHRETLSRIYRLQVEGYGAKGGRNCDGGGITTLRRVCTAGLDLSRRPIYAVLRLYSSLLLYDYDKAFTVSTKARFSTILLLCAYAKKGLRLACRIFTTLYTRHTTTSAL